MVEGKADEEGGYHGQGDLGKTLSVYPGRISLVTYLAPNVARCAPVSVRC